jgi:hypothetical protein
VAAEARSERARGAGRLAQVCVIQVYCVQNKKPLATHATHVRCPTSACACKTQGH